MGWHRSPVVWSTVGLLLVGSVWPTPDTALAAVVLGELVTLSPLIGGVAMLSGWLATSRLAERVRGSLGRRPWRAIVLASLAGAVTLVCGIASVPLVAALLRQGVPMAAAMAFWLSSPITDPGMLLLTAGILGWPFALGKLLAAALLGLGAGALTQWVCRRAPHGCGVRDGALSKAEPTSCDGGGRGFRAEALANFGLVLRWLAFALTLEAVMRARLGSAGSEALAAVDGAWAVPMAVAIGGPLYIEGYAALPMLRGLMEMGLSPGAAMAFLIAGAAVSLYAAIAVWSLVRPLMFLLYLGLGVGGALIAGWTVDALA